MGALPVDRASLRIYPPAIMSMYTITHSLNELKTRGESKQRHHRLKESLGLIPIPLGDVCTTRVGEIAEERELSLLSMSNDRDRYLWNIYLFHCLLDFFSTNERTEQGWRFGTM